MKALSLPVFVSLSCFPAENPRFRPLPVSLCVHSRPFAAQIAVFSPSKGPLIDYIFRIGCRPPLRGRRAAPAPNPAGDATPAYIADLGLKLSLQAPAWPFSAHFCPSSPVACHFQPWKRLLRSFTDENTSREPRSPRSALRGASRASMACLLTPYSPTTQPVAPLTRPRLSAILNT